MRCRFCKNELTVEFLDLVNSPPSNEFLMEEQLLEPEAFYPLKLFVCDKCFLVQVDEYKKSIEIFHDNYLYYSSFSKIWLEHSKKYTEMVIEKFKLDINSYVIEIGCNDGYLLQYFKKRNIPCLGIEPSINTAKIAEAKGINVIEEYFNEFLAKKLEIQNLKADLLIGNNVLAHQPNLNDFISGLKLILKKKGIITLEFPHIMHLIERNEFDTIYHEHYSYFSFLTINSIFESYDLEIFDVDQIDTHGGSLRIYSKHKNDSSKEISKKVNNLLDLEISKGMNHISYYKDFQNKVNKVRYDLLQFLIKQRLKGKKIAAYGAAAKGNTLLNYCGIKKDLIKFVVDISPYKQGRFLPGSHIPIVNEDVLKKYKPDFVVILPWNIKEEILNQLRYIREWGGKFVIAIPNLEIL